MSAIAFNFRNGKFTMSNWKCNIQVKKNCNSVYCCVLIFQYHKVRMDGAKKLMNLDYKYHKTVLKLYTSWLQMFLSNLERDL